MKKVCIMILSILAFSVCSFAVDWYAAAGVDGSYNMGYRTGMIFKIEAYQPFSAEGGDYLSYSSFWMSSANKVETSDGRELNGSEILFRRISSSLYVGAGQSFVYVDTSKWEKRQFNTLISALWYPRDDMKAMLTYARENNNKISGAKLDVAYLFKEKILISAWIGFYRYQHYPTSQSGYLFGSSIGIFVF